MWGYIDKEESSLINATYKDATVFQGVAWVVLEWHQPVDRKGEIKFTLKEVEQVRLFSEDLAAYSRRLYSYIWRSRG
jgi:hypothetical protein